MGVIVSKFWRFCLWLEGGEGVGLVAETRFLEGSYSRTQEEGLVNILKEKLKGVADVKRLKKAASGETILRVNHKEAEQGELFNSVWEFVVIRNKLEAWWVLTLPKEGIQKTKVLSFWGLFCEVESVQRFGRSKCHFLAL